MDKCKGCPLTPDICHGEKADCKIGENEMDKWIPATERLPNNGTDVLVTYKNGDIAIDFIQDDMKWFWYDEEEGLIVTAWMPLPEPYKDGEHK